MNSFLVTLSSSNAQQLTTTGSMLFKTFTAWGYKSFNAGGFPNANTGVVYMGVDPNALAMAINSGSYFNWTVQPNQDESLANFWVKGGVGDGVYIVSY